MITDKLTQAIAEAYKKMKEELVGGQKELDVNKNKRIDSQDLAILRAKNEELEEGHPANLEAIKKASEKSRSNQKAKEEMVRRVNAAANRKKDDAKWEAELNKEEIDLDEDFFTEGYAVQGVRKNKPHLPGYMNVTRHVNGNISSLDLSRGKPSKIFDNEEEAKAHVAEIGAHLSKQRGHGWGPLTVQKVRGKATTNEEFESLDEKAVSQAQQRFMGMVHATQKGDMKAPSPEVAKVAGSMTKKAAKDYASTKLAGLPNHVGEEKEATDDEFHNKWWRKRDRERSAAKINTPNSSMSDEKRERMNAVMNDLKRIHGTEQKNKRWGGGIYPTSEGTEIEEGKKSPWDKLNARLKSHGYDADEVMKRPAPEEKKKDDDSSKKEKTNEELSREASVVKEVYNKAKAEASAKDARRGGPQTSKKRETFDSEPEMDILPVASERSGKKKL